MAHLAHQRDGLQPAEAFLDPLSLSLAQSITGVSGGAAINRASDAPCDVLRHVRGHSHVPALLHETPRIISFVSQPERLFTQCRMAEQMGFELFVGAVNTAFLHPGSARELSCRMNWRIANSQGDVSCGLVLKSSGRNTDNGDGCSTPLEMCSTYTSCR